MSKTWKWILGILFVFVIIGAFAAIGFAWRMHASGFASYRSMPFNQNWDGPMMGRGNENGEQPQTLKCNGGGEHPRMYGRGFHPMDGGFFVLGGLVKLALFFGLLYGAYWLGRRNARIVMDPKAGAPVAEVPAPEAETPPARRGRGKKLA